MLAAVFMPRKMPRFSPESKRGRADIVNGF